MTNLPKNSEAATLSGSNRASMVALYLAAAKLRLLARELGNTAVVQSTSSEMTNLRQRITPTRRP